MENNKGRYGRFWAIFNRMPYSDEDMKSDIILHYTGGRTEHLHEMTVAEYDFCCQDMERKIDENNSYRAELKAHRSAVLHLLQVLGVDTTDWMRVNTFTRNARIAGKDFAMLSVDELDDVCKKLRIIRRKGGLNVRKSEPVKNEEEENDMKSIVAWAAGDMARG